MGTFRISARLANPARRKREVVVDQMVVDTGSELTWVPGRLLEQIGIKREKKDATFEMANCQVITRSIGYAIIHVEEYVTVDEVVFGEEGDLPLLGARTLEGLNLRVDSRNKRLVAAGPIIVASGKAHRNHDRKGL
jgi:predicted aspartyl protease